MMRCHRFLTIVRVFPILERQAECHKYGAKRMPEKKLLRSVSRYILGLLNFIDSILTPSEAVVFTSSFPFTQTATGHSCVYVKMSQSSE